VADLNVINGKVFIPALGVQRVGISIEKGKVTCIGAEAQLPAARETIDASGMHVLPGLISPHIHLGFCKGFEADCRTETRSALVGGVTTVGCYLGLPDPYSKAFPGIQQAVDANASIDVMIHLVINTEEQMREIPTYAKDFGVTSFKFYMFGIPGIIPTQTNRFILEGFREVAKLEGKGVCCVHAEDPSMTGAGWERWEQTEKKDLVEWAACNPDESEGLAVIVASYLAEVAEVKLNILHLCTGIATNRLAAIKKANPYANVEAFVLALALTKHSEAGLRARWAPAIRGEADQETLWQGVKDGTIDTFGCDNVAMDTETIAQFGMGGCALDALMLPILLTEGYHKRGVPLEKILERCTMLPARLFGIYPQKGTIAVGSDADLAIVDLDGEFQVDHTKLHSVADWSLYDGKTLKGQPRIAIKSGEVAMREGEILVEPGFGKYLRR
jgi:dihydropyrimidinase